MTPSVVASSGAPQAGGGTVLPSGMMAAPSSAAAGVVVGPARANASRERAAAETVRLVDTHVHLSDRRYHDDLDRVLERAAAAGVVAMVVVGYDVPSSEAAVALAERYPQLWAAVGVHPHHASDYSAAAERRLTELTRHPRVVAVGECGLDYYRNLSPAEAQRAAFEAQLGVAAAAGLSVVVHSREAMSETLALLAAARPGAGVMHCFDGDGEAAGQVVDLGLHLSAAGPLTYRKDQTLANALASVPLDRLLVETDCPYLSPQGHRGERNEPAHVRAVAEALARVRGLTLEQLAEATTANASRLFGLPFTATVSQEPAA